MVEIGGLRHSLNVLPSSARSQILPSAIADAGAQVGSTIDAQILSPADAYDAYFEVAWRNLHRLGVAAALLEDAVQDVFLVVHRRWGSFRRESTVRTWVIGICLRVAKEYRRKRMRTAHDQQFDDDANPSPDCPENAVERLLAARLLMQLLDGLAEQHRTLLVLVELEGLSVAEAAEAIGIPMSTAYKRLANATRLFERAVGRHQAQSGWRFGCQR